MPTDMIFTSFRVQRGLLNRITIKMFMGLLTTSILTIHCSDNIKLSHHASITHGAVNGVCIERNGHNLVVYGDPNQNLKNADCGGYTTRRLCHLIEYRIWTMEIEGVV
jgi:hypothetical protein